MNIDLLEALNITIMSMGIVFLVLIVLMFVIWLFKFIPNNEKLGKKFKRKRKNRYVDFEKMDDDMKAAVLVATIKYQQETKNDVVLKSVRKL